MSCLFVVTDQPFYLFGYICRYFEILAIFLYRIIVAFSSVFLRSLLPEVQYLCKRKFW